MFTDHLILSIKRSFFDDKSSSFIENVSFDLGNFWELKHWLSQLRNEFQINGIWNQAPDWIYFIESCNTDRYSWTFDNMLLGVFRSPNSPCEWPIFHEASFPTNRSWLLCQNRLFISMHLLSFNLLFSVKRMFALIAYAYQPGFIPGSKLFERYLTFPTVSSILR